MRKTIKKGSESEQKGKQKHIWEGGGRTAQPPRGLRTKKLRGSSVIGKSNQQKQDRRKTHAIAVGKRREKR